MTHPLSPLTSPLATRSARPSATEASTKDSVAQDGVTRDWAVQDRAVQDWATVGVIDWGGLAPSPFAPRVAAAACEPVPPDAATGTYTYRMVRSGPELRPGEMELGHRPAVEVMVLWGSTVLHATHLTPPRAFVVGEDAGTEREVDFSLPAERLGTPRLRVVRVDGATVSVVIPAQARGHVTLPERGRLSLETARAQGAPCPELSGARSFALPMGASARIQLGDFVFQVAIVNAGKPVQRGLGAGFEWSALAYFGWSLGSVGGLLAAMAFFVPPLGLAQDEGLDKEQTYLIQHYLDAAAERERAAQKVEAVTDQSVDSAEGGTGERARSDEGAMGRSTSTARNRHYAVQGPKDNPEPHLAREAALREAREFGVVGLLAAAAAGDVNAPTAPWGGDSASGMDASSAMGNMWGDTLGEAYGLAGLGLTGVGEGGGRRGEGIGLGTIGTLGRGAGVGTGQGFGSGHGHPSGSHTPSAPRLKMGKTEVSGRLPPEVIQRIVRQNFGRFRLCYEAGLARNPNLEGRVSVRFVIGRDGAVSSVGNGGSDMPDQGVVACVIRAYYGLGFPQPEGGIVTVTYPLMFSPG